MLGITVFKAPGGAFIGNWSRRVLECQFETGDHGFRSLNAFFRFSLVESFNIYNDYRGALHIVLSNGAQVVWEGRIEDIQIVTGGIRVIALGYWSALYDAPYTALWSDSKYDRFLLLDQDVSGATQIPAAFEHDNNNRLYMALKQGEDYASDVNQIVWAYEIPPESGRQIVAVDCDYVLDAPSTYRLVMGYYNSSWVITGNVWAVESAGSQLSGSRTDTITATDRIGFRFFYNSTTPNTYSGDTGAAYAKITGLRIKTDSGATITAADIVADLLDHIDNVNSGMISTDTADIDDPGVDLDQAIYLDQYPGDIINELAAIGDNATPPARYEAMFYEDRRLQFREAGSAGRAWYVDIAEPNTQRTINTLINAAYAVYDGGNERTATETDDQSINDNNIKRITAVNATTTSQTTAEKYRDAAIEAAKNGRGRGAIKVRRLFDQNGSPWPGWAARAGDTVTIRNLPPDLVDLDQSRRFRLAGTQYNLMTGDLTLIPAELPSLESLIGGLK